MTTFQTIILVLSAISMFMSLLTIRFCRQTKELNKSTYALLEQAVKKQRAYQRQFDIAATDNTPLFRSAGRADTGSPLR